MIQGKALLCIECIDTVRRIGDDVAESGDPPE